MRTDWRITIYDMVWQASTVSLEGEQDRFIYVKDGRAQVDPAAGEPFILGSDEGGFVRGSAQISGEGSVWMFEVGRNMPPDLQNPGLIAVLSKGFQLSAAPGRLLRADRIESASGAATPRHVHRGPGMRRLIRGQLMAEIGEDVERIDAGHAWFETGHDPVVGTNIHDANSAFVRVMVLPLELVGGKSSFVPSSPSEALKPRSVQNRLFGEVTI